MIALEINHLIIKLSLAISETEKRVFPLQLGNALMKSRKNAADLWSINEGGQHQRPRGRYLPVFPTHATFPYRLYSFFLSCLDLTSMKGNEEEEEKRRAAK